MEYNNKGKLKEQNSSRLTDSKKGLVVTKGQEWERAGGEGGRRGWRSIMIGIHGVWESHRQDSVTQRRQTSSGSVASYFTDGQ